MRDVLLILTYLDQGPVAVGQEKMRQLLRDRMPDQEERIMGWITQPYFEDGMEKGRAEGRTEGQAKSLVRLLERRFGTVPEELRAKVFDADVPSLDAWLDRVFDAPDLQAIFAEHDISKARTGHSGSAPVTTGWRPSSMSPED
jgi:Domain of unknown function (DUF4351)